MDVGMSDFWYFIGEVLDSQAFHRKRLLVMSFFLIFIKMANSSILSQYTQIHLLTTLVIWIQLIQNYSKCFKNWWGRSWGVMGHIRTYIRYIINWYTQPWSSIFKGIIFGTRLVNLGGGNPPRVLEQISSQHCTTFTNGGYGTWIYYKTLIKLYFKHHIQFLGRIWIQENSMNLLVVLRFQPPMVDDSK